MSADSKLPTVLPVAPPTTQARQSLWQFKNVRLYLSFLLCLNFLVLALMRNGLGIAMVCMVNNTAIKEATMGTSHWFNNDTANDSCPVLESTQEDYEGEFLWDREQQGMLFAAIYWGSMTSLPAGWLSDRYSPRHLMLYSAILNVICSFATPLAARYGGYIPMFIVRLVMGTGQGLQKPATSAFTARWIPTGERSTVISLYTAGNQLANIFGSPLNAWMCSERQILGGWPLIFIVSGAMGAIWCFFWICCVRNCPDHHPRIRVTEREYIKNNLKTQNLHARKEAAKNVPWRALLLSMPVIACSICSFVNGLYVSLTSSYIPTYFMEVLKLDLKSNGFYTSLPYVSQWILKFVFAIMSDKMVRTGKWNATFLSKIFNSIASFGTGAFILACGFLDCTQSGLAVAFLTISMGLFGSFTPGYWTSMVTIAPVYTGTISSLTTTTNQLGSILAPYMVAVIKKTGSKAEWQLIFIITASTLIATGVFYIIFGSADIQPWARAPATPQSDNKPPGPLQLAEKSMPLALAVAVPSPKFPVAVQGVVGRDNRAFTYDESSNDQNNNNETEHSNTDAAQACKVDLPSPVNDEYTCRF